MNRVIGAIWGAFDGCTIGLVVGLVAAVLVPACRDPSVVAAIVIVCVSCSAIVGTVFPGLAQRAAEGLGWLLLLWR